MSNEFNPAFDMPSTTDEALAVMQVWASPTCYTFSATRAKRCAELLAAHAQFAAAQVGVTDEQLLSAFNSAESVIDGLHEVVGLLSTHPAGAAGPVFGAAKRFAEWFSMQQFAGMGAREIASLAFNEGHLFWHEKEMPYSTMLAVKAVEPDAIEASMRNIDALVNRFLGWRLPKTFSPDCGISFDGRKDEEWNKNKPWPIGTHLLTADEAKAMLEYVLAAPIAVIGDEATTFQKASLVNNDMALVYSNGVAEAKRTCDHEFEDEGSEGCPNYVCKHCGAYLGEKYAETIPPSAPAVGADARVTHCSTKYLSKLQRDAERLDWFDKQVIGYGFDETHVGDRWSIEGPYGSIREAIDAYIADAALAAQSKEKK